MQANETNSVIGATATIVAALESLDEEQRLKAFEMVRTYFGMSASTPVARAPDGRGEDGLAPPRAPNAKIDANESPKTFLNRKKPKSETERMACLGFYLATYRGMSEFKTIDLTKLNTEAALGKLTNPSNASASAVKQGYFAQAGKGNRQMSARGEALVQALPNREEVTKALEEHPKKKKKSGKKKKAPKQQRQG